ncbi:unnamed protein product, partial [Urochloa humidicola]
CSDCGLEWGRAGAYHVSRSREQEIRRRLEGLLAAPPPGDPSPPAPRGNHPLEGRGERLPEASGGAGEGRVAAGEGASGGAGEKGSAGASGGRRPATRSGGAGGTPTMAT